MEVIPVAGDLLAAILVLSLFAATEWSAKNNLPSALRDEFKKVIANNGMAGNHPARMRRDRDSHAIYRRGS
ncbi:hypothetical protein [Paraburkholderia sp. J41]|uniref:hypothetical protein n=1 Tax=Paraburkholderia sp. J41 TaxID=2805433 RepID=UPI002AC328B1|nr:hypothetical protein [Paraburkholderia sp. J41]